MAPLTVVVLDAGGGVVCAKREDGSGIMRFDVAFAKARWERRWQRGPPSS
eukprot:CAMPEP_0113990818 /NCGR_PEP_ID=MMETSP0328-20130328/8751_1 /TAXON_ID=39455 /ORGANISM="Alexandrium minutum" /LENGTH=49 /assembly_acc=CAM_ASM_000350